MKWFHCILCILCRACQVGSVVDLRMQDESILLDLQQKCDFNNWTWSSSEFSPGKTKSVHFYYFLKRCYGMVRFFCFKVNFLSFNISLYSHQKSGLQKYPVFRATRPYLSEPADPRLFITKMPFFFRWGLYNWGFKS